MNHGKDDDDDDDVKDNRTTYQSHDDCNEQHDDAWYAVKLYITEQLIFQCGFNPEIVRDAIEKVIVNVSVMVDNNDVSKQVVLDDQNISIDAVVTGIEGASIGWEEVAIENHSSIDTQKKHKHHRHDNVQELVDVCCQYILENNLDVDRGGPIAPIGDCPHLETASMDSILHDYIITFTNTTTSSSDQNPHRDDERFVPNRLSEDTIAVLACTNYYHPEIAACSHVFDDEHNDDESKSQQLSSPHTCSSQVENWLCYSCGVVRCSRYVHGHNIQHWKDTMSSNEKLKAVMTKKDTNEQQSVDDHGHCIAISLHDLSVWCHQCQSYIFHPTLLGPVLDYLQTMKFPPIQHGRVS